MKTSDYIVEYLIDKGITNVFDYNEVSAVSPSDTIFNCRLEG